MGLAGVFWRVLTHLTQITKVKVEVCVLLDVLVVGVALLTVVFMKSVVLCDSYSSACKGKGMCNFWVFNAL